MSAYIRLATPMTSVESLLDALADVGCTPVVAQVTGQSGTRTGASSDQSGATSQVINLDSTGTASLVWAPTGFRLEARGAAATEFGQSWLRKVSERYDFHRAAKEQRLAEEQRLAAEEERRRLVEAQRRAVIEAAKKQGYRIEERQEHGCVRFVLSKRVY
jgi:hypothetical protein